MNRTMAKLISYIFHPLLLFYVLVVLTYWVNPFAFRVEQGTALGIMRIMTFIILVFFPLLATVLMKGLKLISSFEMEDKQERIGPMIATIVFYIWYFINIKNDPAYPSHMAMIALGGTISLCAAFFINNFSKISLHTVGAGSFVAGMIILLTRFKSSKLLVDINSNVYELSPYLIIGISLLLAGLIGTSRLILGVHKKDDLYGGYIVGILSMLIAMKIMV